MVEMSFEELMTELKKTLDSLEKGDLSLEDSMLSYERGVVLVRHLEDKLRKMEGRMEEILSDGSIKEFAGGTGEADGHDAT